MDIDCTEHKNVKQKSKISILILKTVYPMYQSTPLPCRTSPRKTGPFTVRHRLWRRAPAEKPARRTPTEAPTRRKGASSYLLTHGLWQQLHCDESG